jgi:hypothetical protein
MAVSVSERFTQNLGAVRIEPTAKRIRAVVDGQTVVDSQDALLVWESKRIVPTYAVPERDIDASVRSVAPVDITVDSNGRDFARVPVRDPRVPFGVRLTPGHPVLVERSGSGFAIDGFIAEDPDLDGYVILDFDGFDTWLEEDDPIERPRPQTPRS